ncbi:MAG TPA: MAB_1171c family putative transporter [Amycolatopsis sp.]|nr:MAB_1171c family putative transporter [Amycolatopsis sp.]
MTTIVYPLCAGIAFLALLYRIRKAVAVPNLANIGLCGIFCFIVLGWGLVTPWLWHPIAETFGISSLGGLLAQISVIAIIACNTVVLLHYGYDRKEAWRRVTPRLALVTAVVIAMVVLFNSTYTDDRAGFAVSRAISSPAYLAVYISAFAVGQYDVRRLARRAIRAAPTMWVRRAFRVIIAATLLQLIYVLGRVADILAPLLFDISGAAWEPITVAALGVGSILYTVGWFLPDLGPHLSAAWVLLRQRAFERELAGLHARLVTAVPQVARELSERDTGDGTAFRITRYLVENRDAQRSLTAWMNPEATAAATRIVDAERLSPEKRAAAIEAAQLRAAIAAKTNGFPAGPLDPDSRIAEPDGRAEEILFQLRVARAFSTPLVGKATKAMINDSGSRRQ